jgi:YebC/PmpR family DNA-binding regulatory protein
MSGHSKWATTKRAKAVVDAKRGAIFTKLANLITIAAKEKGGDPDTNFSLRMAIEKAKTANMPKDNIERAVKRGTGELAGEQIIELIYEGIGPANSQFVIKSLTDNKNRSASNIRHLFTKYGGSLGSVMWNFEQKGVIRISNDELKDKNLNNENFELELIDAGAQDIKKEDEGITVFSNTEDLQKVKKLLDDHNVGTESADLEYVAKDETDPAEADREKIEKFIEELDECEDISDYYTNVNL